MDYRTYGPLSIKGHLEKGSSISLTTSSKTPTIHYNPKAHLTPEIQKMNPLLLVTLLAAGAAANTFAFDSNMPGRQIPILRFNQEIRGGQSDNVNFETGNGIRSVFNTQVVRGRGGSFTDESGRLVQSDSSLEQSGHSYHQAPDGRHIALTWTADSNGFHPVGEHLPVPVQLPEEHAQAHREALAIAAANPPQPQDNGYSSNGPSYSSYSAPAQPALVRVQSYNAPAPAIRGGY